MTKEMRQTPQGLQIKTKIKVSKRRDDDYLWKLFLSKYLYSFIALLHPELYELIDTGVPYQPLDTAMLAYYIRLMLLHDMPITAVALYTGKGAAPKGAFAQEHFSTATTFR